MAQAARLSLRMQKEIKLLLSDPPPGATFPSLSSASDASSSTSLTAIDAEIDGPEDTVYSGGVFKIRIEIPERYPFQPPIVTFSTPVYHPNIDNGGRICLDILNLPPKGAWQPSLNISTLITSIGLLLSEPNPDDGLMCEASREFKYNKQAFDLKARTMTEKYAKASSGKVSISQGPQQTVEHRLTGDIEVGHEIKIKDSNCIINSSKPLGMRKKLSLDPLVSHCTKNDNGKESEVSDPVLSNLDSKRKSEPGESNPKLKETDEIHKMGASYFPKRQKLSLKLPVQPEQSECDNKRCLVDQQVPSHSNPSNIQTVNGSNLPSSLVSNSNQQGPDMDPAAQGRVSIEHENSKKYPSSKKLSLGFYVMSRNHENCENENVMPVRNSTVEPHSKENLSSVAVKPEFTKQAGFREDSGDNELNKNKQKGLRSFSDTETCSMSRQRGCTEEGTDAAQDMQQSDSSVIVLDSDESDQEEERSRCRRSKLSLLSKRPF